VKRKTLGAHFTAVMNQIHEHHKEIVNRTDIPRTGLRS